jgi:hypothetical protein
MQYGLRRAAAGRWPVKEEAYFITFMTKRFCRVVALQHNAQIPDSLSERYLGPLARLSRFI